MQRKQRRRATKATDEKPLFIRGPPAAATNPRERREREKESEREREREREETVYGREEEEGDAPKPLSAPRPAGGREMPEKRDLGGFLRKKAIDQRRQSGGGGGRRYDQKEEEQERAGKRCEKQNGKRERRDGIYPPLFLLLVDKRKKSASFPFPFYRGNWSEGEKRSLFSSPLPKGREGRREGGRGGDRKIPSSSSSCQGKGGREKEERNPPYQVY